MQEGGWQDLVVDFDFSEFATKDQRDSEHKLNIKFKNSPTDTDFKDAYIIGKI